MEYKGLIVTQSQTNYHVAVYKNGKMIAHISCNGKKSDKELRNIADFILHLQSSKEG